MLFVYPPENAKSTVYYVMQNLKCLLPNVVVKVQNHAVYNYNTVEPPNSGHIGTRHFVLYREVVLSLEVEMYLIKLGTTSVSFFAPLFGVSPLLASLIAA